jgi:hypothetical protein
MFLLPVFVPLSWNAWVKKKFYNSDVVSVYWGKKFNLNIQPVMRLRFPVGVPRMKIFEVPVVGESHKLSKKIKPAV